MDEEIRKNYYKNGDRKVFKPHEFDGMEDRHPLFILWEFLKVFIPTVIWIALILFILGKAMDGCCVMLDQEMEQMDLDRQKENDLRKEKREMLKADTELYSEIS